MPWATACLLFLLLELSSYWYNFSQIAVFLMRRKSIREAGGDHNFRFHVGCAARKGYQSSHTKDRMRQ